MSVEAGFDLGDLNELNEKLLNLAQEEFPKEAKKFIRRQGSKCETRLRNAYKTKVKKKTGNLIAGVKRGMPQLYDGSYQIRVYNNAGGSDQPVHCAGGGASRGRWVPVSHGWSAVQSLFGG